MGRRVGAVSRGDNEEDATGIANSSGMGFVGVEHAVADRDHVVVLPKRSYRIKWKIALALGGRALRNPGFLVTSYTLFLDISDTTRAN